MLPCVGYVAVHVFVDVGVGVGVGGCHVVGG